MVTFQVGVGGEDANGGRKRNAMKKAQGNKDHGLDGLVIEIKKGRKKLANTSTVFSEAELESGVTK